MATRSGPSFQPTLWSVVLHAKDPKDPHRNSAVNRLCARYWRPLYVFLRRRGYSPQDAEDATQGFLAYFLEKGLLDRVDRSRGRFRTYLLTLLETYCANEYRRARTKKRGGGVRVLSLDFSKAESEVRLEPAAGGTPEEAFRKSWALAALQSALDALKEDFREPGQYEAIRSHLSAKDDRPSYEVIARRLGLTAAGVTNLLHRARKAFRERIRSALRETVESESEVDEEIRDLFDSV